jgi:hypothetical protein
VQHPLMRHDCMGTFVGFVLRPTVGVVGQGCAVSHHGQSRCALQLRCRGEYWVCYRCARASQAYFRRLRSPCIAPLRTAFQILTGLGPRRASATSESPQLPKTLLKVEPSVCRSSTMRDES